MSTLRYLVKSDPALASITSEECLLIARAIDVLLWFASSFLFRWFVPVTIRGRDLELRMLSACLGRTPQEREPIQLTEQIKAAMERDRKNGS